MIRRAMEMNVCCLVLCQTELPEERFDIFFEKISENERRIAVVKVGEADED